MKLSKSQEGKDKDQDYICQLHAMIPSDNKKKLLQVLDILASKCGSDSGIGATLFHKFAGKGCTLDVIEGFVAGASERHEKTGVHMRLLNYYERTYSSKPSEGIPWFMLIIVPSQNEKLYFTVRGDVRASVNLDVVKNSLGYDEFRIADQNEWRLHYLEEKQYIYEEEDATTVKSFQEIKVTSIFLCSPQELEIEIALDSKWGTLMHIWIKWDTRTCLFLNRVLMNNCGVVFGSWFTRFSFDFCLRGWVFMTRDGIEMRVYRVCRVIRGAPTSVQQVFFFGAFCNFLV